MLKSLGVTWLSGMAFVFGAYTAKYIKEEFIDNGKAKDIAKKAANSMKESHYKGREAGEKTMSFLKKKFKSNAVPVPPSM